MLFNNNNFDLHCIFTFHRIFNFLKLQSASSLQVVQIDELIGMSILFFASHRISPLQCWIRYSIRSVSDWCVAAKDEQLITDQIDHAIDHLPKFIQRTIRYIVFMQVIPNVFARPFKQWIYSQQWWPTRVRFLLRSVKIVLVGIWIEWNKQRLLSTFTWNSFKFWQYGSVRRHPITHTFSSGYCLQISWSAPFTVPRMAFTSILYWRSQSCMKSSISSNGFSGWMYKHSRRFVGNFSTNNFDTKSSKTVQSLPPLNARNISGASYVSSVRFNTCHKETVIYSSRDKKIKSQVLLNYR